MKTIHNKLTEMERQKLDRSSGMSLEVNEEGPSFYEAMIANAELESELFQITENVQAGRLMDGQDDPDFSLKSHLKPDEKFESYWDVTNEEQLINRRIQVQREQERWATANEGGFLPALIGGTAGMLTSPSYWPLLLAAPFAGTAGTISGASRLGGAFMAEAVVHETIMNGLQHDRPAAHSAANIAISGLFGLGIGGAVGAASKRKLLKYAADDVVDAGENSGYAVMPTPSAMRTMMDTPTQPTVIRSADADFTLTGQKLNSSWDGVSFNFGDDAIESLPKGYDAELEVIKADKGLTVKALKKELQALGYKSTGKKAQLQEMLAEARALPEGDRPFYGVTRDADFADSGNYTVRFRDGEEVQIYADKDRFGNETWRVVGDDTLKGGSMGDVLEPMVKARGGDASAMKSARAGALAEKGTLVKSQNLGAWRPFVNTESEELATLFNTYFGHDLAIIDNMRPVYKKEMVLRDPSRPHNSADTSPDYNPIVGWKETDEVIGYDHKSKATSMSREVDRLLSQEVVNAEKALRDGFELYSGSKLPLTIQKLTKKGRKQFRKYNEELRWAQSNGDVARDGNEVITNVARKIRVHYDKAYKMAMDADLWDGADPAKGLKYAQSYGNRIWDRLAVQDDIKWFREALIDGFQRDRALYAMQARRDQLYEKWYEFDKKIKERPEKIKAELKSGREAFEKAKKSGDKAEIAKTKARVKRWEKAEKGEDKTMDGWKEKAADLRKQIDELKEEDFVDTDPLTLLELEDQADRAIDKILHGDIGAAYYSKPGKGSPFKERQIPIDDAVLLERGLLNTNMMHQVESYMNKTLRPAMMKLKSGDTEMAGEIQTVLESLAGKAARARQRGDTKAAEYWVAQRQMANEVLPILVNRYYGRPAVNPRAENDAIHNSLRTMRNVNTTLMMGGVTVTSLADPIRIQINQIYMPEISRHLPGILSRLSTATKIATNPEARRALQKWGIAHEQARMVRMAQMLDSGQDVLALKQGNIKRAKIMEGARAASRGMMKINLLGMWTDYWKMVDAAIFQNELIAAMKNYDNLKPLAKKQLAEAGVDRAFIDRVLPQFDEFGGYTSYGGTDLGADDWTDEIAREMMMNVLFRHSERTIITPNESTMPTWFDDEYTRTAMQFKTFSFAAHQQFTVPLAQRATDGDYRAWMSIGHAIYGGLATEISKRLIAGEDLSALSEESLQSLALAGIDRSGIVPMLLMPFNFVDQLSGNAITNALNMRPRNPYYYGTSPTIGALGPSVSTLGTIGRAISNPTDARTIRRLVPYNQHFLPDAVLNRVLYPEGRPPPGQ